VNEPEAVRRLLAQARDTDPRVLLACAAALLTHALGLLVEPPPAKPEPEAYNLKAEEAAPLLGMSKRWLYDHAPELPYARRHGKRSWRFSRAGIERASKPR
jgi:hypothetical protein